MDTKTYGSRAWMESQYAASKDDPWGLDWRPSQRHRYARMFGALQDALPVQPRPRAIVDVGCATGAFTAMLGGLGDTAEDGAVTGIDIAESAVARAAMRFPAIRFRCMALDECARAYEGSADVVTCMEVLYYLPREQRADAVHQLKRMLKPGGHLLVSSMIASGPYFSFGELKALMAGELNVVVTGVLHLKPLTLLEKLLMKLGPAARQLLRIDDGTVRRWERFSARRFPGLAQSHAYVIARNS
jgi:SAM-dependent methyltransferase